MAGVDWTGYKLAPDFSGLAQGIQNFGLQKQQSAQFQQEMDYKNRALAAEQQRAMLGGANNQFYADVFLRKDPATGKNRYFRSGIDPQGNPIEVALPEGYEPVTAAGAFGLSNAQAIADAETIKAQQVEAAKQAERVAAARKLESEKGAGQAAAVADIEGEKGKATERNKIISNIRSGHEAALKVEPTLYELEKAMNLASQGKYAQAGTFVGKFLPGVDVSNEQAFNSAILQFSTDRLLAIPGIATDSDFQNQLKSFVSQGNTSGANKLIIERVKRQNDYNKFVYKSYNQVKDKKGFDALSWEQPSYGDFIDYQEFQALKKQNKGK